MNRWMVIPALALVAGGCAHYEPKPLSAARSAHEFESRSLDAPALRQFLQTNLHRPLSDWPLPEWDFPTLTLVAFYYHPSLDVARAQWAIADAGIRTAGGRPNPILSVTPGYSSNPANGVSPWFPMVSVDVPIETAGKRQKRITHAGDLAESTRLNVYSVAWQVRSQLRAVLLDWYTSETRARLLKRQLKVQEQLVELLEQRRIAGAVAAVEITPARVALLKLSADLEAANREVASSRVRLGEALGVSATSVASVRLAPEPVLPPESAEILLTNEARNRSLQSRPDVLAALADYAATESALRLEVAKQYPDVHLSPGYQFDQGEHKWSLGLSMELPLLNRNQGPIGEADARRAESAARFLAVQARAVAEIDRAAESYAANREQFRRGEALLEALRNHSTAIDAAFQAGGADRFEVESARLEVLVAELTVADSSNRIQRALGQLEDALQVPFEGLNSVEQLRSDRTMKENEP